jgi:subtilase family serine protease
VSNPASPSYRRFLSRAGFARRFAPTAAEASTALGWLHRAGFTVDRITANRSAIEAHASAATVAHAFATKLARFRVGAQLLRAPLTEPTMPTALRGVVSAVAGLAQTPAVLDAGPAPGFANARPCSTYYGQKTATKQPKYAGKHQKYAVCGYTAKQIRSAYGVNRVKSQGKGAKVGIVDAFASSSIVSDVNTWSKRGHLPGLKPNQLVQITDGPITNPPEVDPEGLGVVDPQGWAGEESLDVEAVHGMAPAATIYYYAAAQGIGLNLGPFEVGLEPLLTSLVQAVDADQVQIISDSWGGANESPTPGDTQLLDQATNEAAAEGITIDFSSGDSGDEVAEDGARTADFPATSTGVTAVGGTDLQVNKQGHRVRETYWGTQKIPLLNGRWDFAGGIFNGAGGGGVSTVFAQPAWQKKIVPVSESTYGGLKAPGRVEPDVSMDADPTTGFLIGQTQAFAGGSVHYGQYRIGGTSVSCPLFSGILALAVAENHGKGLGLVTPTLYKDARTAKGRRALFWDEARAGTRGGRSAYANVRPDYTDTTNPKSKVLYSLRLLGTLGTLHARPGFDDATGLGSPKAWAVVRALR